MAERGKNVNDGNRAGHSSQSCYDSHPLLPPRGDCETLLSFQKAEAVCREFVETRPAEVIANIAICLSHQTNDLMDQQLHRLENDFLEQGGPRERMARARLHCRNNRNQSHSSHDSHNSHFHRAANCLETTTCILEPFKYRQSTACAARAPGKDACGKNAEELYLDLLKKTLCFALWPEPPIPIERFNYKRPPVKRFGRNAHFPDSLVARFSACQGRSHPQRRKGKKAGFGPDTPIR